jgi:putative ABC transport system substrate-binding protein
VDSRVQKLLAALLSSPHLRAHVPVAAPIIAAQPGGNITGVTAIWLELDAKRLEILKEAVPHAAHITVLTNPAIPAHAANMQDLTVASRLLGVALHVVKVRRADELDTAFAAMAQARVDALLVVDDGALVSSSLRKRIADLAATSRLPAMYGPKFYVEARGLMSYGPSFPDIWRRAATYVDKILKGAKLADLPSSNPPNLSSSSTSRPPRPSASRSLRAYSSRRTRYRNSHVQGSSKG